MRLEQSDRPLALLFGQFQGHDFPTSQAAVVLFCVSEKVSGYLFDNEHGGIGSQK
jgi:hypothetical protein